MGDIFYSVDDSYWFCQTLLRDVIDFHAPIKKRIVKGNQVPYMNSELRKANMLWRKFERQRCNMNWERYRTRRNLVVKLRKRSKSEHLRNWIR